MSDSNVQVNLRVSDGAKLATCLNGDEHSQKIVPSDATGVPYSAANPQNVAITGEITPGTAAGNLGKAQGTTANASDVGVASLYKRTDTPGAIGSDGQYVVPITDNYGRTVVVGSVTVSNGVPGIADDTGSNFAVGTTQGLAIMALADEGSTDSVGEDRAGVVRMTLDRMLRVVAVQESGYIKVGGTSAQVKYASVAISSSGDNQIVAAVSGKKIRLVSAALSANGSVNAKWRRATTDISGLYYLTTSSGAVLPRNEDGWFETGSNEALQINLSGAVAVGGHISYIEV